MFYDNLDSSWSELINQELKKEYFKKLLFFLKNEYSSEKIHPQKSLIFNAFFKPVPGAIFRGPRRQSIPKVRYFMDLGTPLGPQMIPCNTIFDQKRAKRRTGPNEAKPSRADLGAIWSRKRSKDAVPLILDGFSMDFGWIFNQFGMVCL